MVDYIISFSTGPFCLGKDVDGASKSLLTGFEDDGAWLDPRFPIEGTKMYKKCRSEGAGAVLLDSSLIPSPPIMPQDRVCAAGP